MEPVILFGRIKSLLSPLPFKSLVFLLFLKFSFSLAWFPRSGEPCRIRHFFARLELAQLITKTINKLRMRVLCPALHPYKKSPCAPDTPVLKKRFLYYRKRGRASCIIGSASYFTGSAEALPMVCVRCAR